MLSPRFCHRFVGYLEEEAVKTYTYCLKVNNLFKLTISCLTWEGGAILVDPLACTVVASWLDAKILDKNVTLKNDFALCSFKMKLFKCWQLLTKLIISHSCPKQICWSLAGSFLSLTEQHWPGCGARGEVIGVPNLSDRHSVVRNCKILSTFGPRLKIEYIPIMQ